MVQDKFFKRKTDVLSKSDKSHKGGLDDKIKKLCNKINSSNDYYTTSSCSGRIVLIINQDKKEKDLFVKVYHDKISFEQLKKDLIFALKKNKNIKFKFKQDQRPSIDSNLKIKFKSEPCALHVACRSLKDAQELYDKAKLAGWKRSGIIASNNRFMTELNSTEKIEFPIIQNKKILVNDEFLKIVVDEANKKLEKSWKKIERLKERIK